jgi:hypothetical protein
MDLYDSGNMSLRFVLHPALARISDQRGITGLETAIILISFIVVASVFAFTVLSAGLFAAEKGKESTYAGVKQAQTALIQNGRVGASAVLPTMLDDAEDGWTTPNPDVANSLDLSDRKEGSAALTITIDAGFTTGLVARENIGSGTDISDHYSVRLWMKVNLDVAAGVLELLLDNNTNCASPIEAIPLPALHAASGWQRVQIKLTDPSLLTGVRCTGLQAASDPGALEVYVDQIESPPEVVQLQIPLTITGGKGINMRPAADSDEDGLFSDETALHSLIVLISDKDQSVSDVAWTVQWLGKGDDDWLLETGEQLLLTLEMKGLDPIPTEARSMDITLIPSSGGRLRWEITTPNVIDSVVLLR